MSLCREAIGGSSSGSPCWSVTPILGTFLCYEVSFLHGKSSSRCLSPRNASQGVWVAFANQITPLASIRLDARRSRDAFFARLVAYLLSKQLLGKRASQDMLHLVGCARAQPLFREETTLVMRLLSHSARNTPLSAPHSQCCPPKRSSSFSTTRCI